MNDAILRHLILRDFLLAVACIGNSVAIIIVAVTR